MVAVLYAGAAILYIVLYIAGFSGFSQAERISRGIIFLLFVIAAVFAVIMWRKVISMKMSQPRKLSEMTREELWQLFPIYLVGHKDSWKAQYEKEKAFLSNLFEDLPSSIISHMGSTSIDKIQAKDIVDLLIEVDPQTGLAPYMDRMKASGAYNLMASDETTADYNKGYTPYGFAPEVYHLHFRLFGDNRELYFRDYMNAHPELAKEYEKLKLGLWGKYEHNRDTYTEGKGEFITKYTEIAKKEYYGRYER